MQLTPTNFRRTSLGRLLLLLLLIGLGPRGAGAQNGGTPPAGRVRTWAPVAGQYQWPRAAEPAPARAWSTTPEHRVLAAPVITSFTPSSGPAGTVVTVTGSGFTGAVALTLNGAPLPSFSVITDVQIVFVVPVGASSGNIGVITPSGTAISAGVYTVSSGPVNPLPTITSLSPPSVPSGSGGFTLVVNGTGFVPASVVQSTAPVSQTTYVSATQLSVTLPPGAVTGTYPVTVTNPAPGGGTSAPFNFFVTSTTGPAPTITGFTPSSAIAGTLITVTGTAFVGATSVTLNGAPVGTFTVVSPTQLTFNVSTSSSTGRIAVTTPGGTAVSAGVLTVVGNPTNPQPTITSLSPPSVLPGAGAFVLTITGTGFLPTSAVTFNNFPLPITFISATQISVQLPAGAVLGVYPVVVTNPAPGGGSSAPFNFIVAAGPAPTITGFTPASAVAGTLVTVTGTNFTGATSVTLNGASVGSFTVVSPTQLTFVVSTNASTGRIAVTTPGGTAVSATNLVVMGNPNNPLPVITGLSPASVPPGSGAFTLIVTGTGFVPTSLVQSLAPVSQTTYLSATQLLVTLPPGAVTGTYPVTVINPAPGGGTSAPFNFFVTAAPLATISGFSPSSGPVGTTVTVTGTNLSGVTGVLFNNRPASFTVNSATQLTAVVPVGATSGLIAVIAPTTAANSNQQFTVTIGTATRGAQQRAALTLYPNPARDEVTLVRSGANGAPVQIRDLTGRLLRTALLPADGRLSLRGLAPGLYTVTVGEGAQAITRQLLKE